MENLKIRKAEINDVDFLIDTIINAEKSGTDKLSYAGIFEINEAEVRSILKNILPENIEGQELCISSFLIVEIDGELAGACASWIEGDTGMPSSIIKANLIYNYFGKERILNANEKSVMLKALHIEREKGTLQFESAYVKDKFKGNGISNKMMLAHVGNYLKIYPDITKAQIIMVKTNDKALLAHQKLGFKIVKEVFVDDDKILEILPSNRLILIESNITDLKINL